MSIETVEAPSPRPRVAVTRPAPQPASTLFRVMWRWHFYAGLLVSPLLIVVALTGGIYLFAAEIGDVVNSDLLYVKSTGAVAPYQSLVTRAEAAIPGGKATDIGAFADPRRTVAISVTPPGQDAKTAGSRRGQGTTVYVDPYTAEVQEVSRGPKTLDGFFRTVLKIHRELFAGTTGRIVVELATTWTLVLFVTGVYLWWPRRKEKVKGVWVPRWPAKPYAVLRDVHALVGIYLMPVCLVIIVTGFFYTLVWGESFHFVSKRFFADSAAVASTEEGSGEGSEAGRAAGGDAIAEPYVPPTFTLQQAVIKSRTLYPDRDLTVSLPSKSADHYDVSAINDYARGTYGAMNSTGFKIDRDSGQVFDVEHLSDNERYWWHTWAYPLHVGSVLGMTSKVLWLAACVILVVLPFTGLWMWWKRRPRGRTGFPRNPTLEAVPGWVWAAILLLCLVLPLFALSAALIAAAEFFLRKRDGGSESDKNAYRYGT